MFRWADLVLETTETTGIGTYSLEGAELGFQTFVSGVGDSSRVHYAVADGTDWEVAEGVISSGSPDTLTRVRILASSNSGAAVSWGVGSRKIGLVNPAEKIQGIPDEVDLQFLIYSQG